MSKFTVDRDPSHGWTVYRSGKPFMRHIVSREIADKHALKLNDQEPPEHGTEQPPEGNQ